MARNPEIEAILEAWYAWQISLPDDKAKSKGELVALLDAVVAKGQSAVTREQIQDFLWPQYKEYRLGRKKEERLGVAQSALRR